MILYHDPRSRSVRALAVLEELNVHYELANVSLTAQEHKSEVHRRLHPLGQLPVLVDGDVTIFESTAICMYLADRYPERGLCPPPDSTARGHYYQWCAFVSGSLEPAFGRTYQEHHGGQFVPGTPSLHDVLAVLARAVTEKPYLLPSGFSAADALVGTTLSLLPGFGIELPPPLDAYVERLRARPAVLRAWTMGATDQ